MVCLLAGFFGSVWRFAFWCSFLPLPMGDTNTKNNNIMNIYRSAHCADSFEYVLWSYGKMVLRLGCRFSFSSAFLLFWFFWCVEHDNDTCCDDVIVSLFEAIIQVHLEWWWQVPFICQGCMASLRTFLGHLVLMMHFGWENVMGVRFLHHCTELMTTIQLIYWKDRLWHQHWVF